MIQVAAKCQVIEEELLQLLDDGMGTDVVEKEKPHNIDGNVGDKKIPFSVKKYDCVVKKRWCETHKKPATKYTDSKRCWTRNAKTGLFGNKTRKVSSWRCGEGVVLPFDSIT